MKENSLKNKRVLITSGPTWVPIDDMRIISNRSSGMLGRLLAEEFTAAGASVTALEGVVEKRIPAKKVKVIKFAFFDEFLELIKKETRKNYDIIVHAAAVSDYRVKNPSHTKISSSHDELKIDLVPTEKVIRVLKQHNPKAILIGFKLESKMDAEVARNEAKELMDMARCDFVVANTLPQKNYRAFVLNKENKIISMRKTRKSLAKELVKITRNAL